MKKRSSKFCLYLLIFLLPTISSAQKVCDDLTCLQYLLATDPNTPAVAAYIEKFGGHKFDSEGKNPHNVSFTFFTSQMPVNRYDASSDYRYLINRITVNDTNVLKEILPKMGNFYVYDEGRRAKHIQYPKKKKKHTTASVSLPDYDAFYNPRNAFSDLWRGTIAYKRNHQGKMVAISISYEMDKSYALKMIGYNPVGWHEYDEKTRLKQTICSSGNCLVCCPVCSVEDLKGVTRTENPVSSNWDFTTINVLETDLTLPLGVSKSVTMQELQEQFGGYEGVPWEKPKLEDNIYQFHSGNGIKFIFENNRLKTIKSDYILCSKDLVPNKNAACKVKIIAGAETDDSPGIVEYQQGFTYTYYGERKNGLPHGFGALIRPLIMEDNGFRKAIYTNFYQNGFFADYKILPNPICLNGDCSESGTMLTSLGIYEGPVKDGIPIGPGKLTYTVDVDWYLYEGTFKYGLPYNEDGIIKYVDGRTYRGGIAFGKPDGNGAVYDRWNRKEEEGYYEKGFRKGPKKVKAVEKPISIFKYNPLKQNWKKDFLPFMTFQLISVDSLKVFGTYGSNFYNKCVYCIKYEHNITNTNYLIECLRSNYSSEVSSQASKSYKLIEEYWHELDTTFYSIVCNDDIDLYVKSTRDAFDKYAYFVNHLDDYMDAFKKQLLVKEAQNSLPLAKQMYDKGIVSFKNHLDNIDSYYASFVKELNELNRKIIEQRCNYRP